MNKIHYYLIHTLKMIGIFLTVLILVSCQKDKAMDAVYPIGEKAVILNIAYGADSKQKMDLYLPANRNESTKVIVLIHGGGWNKGDKTDFSFMPTVFADSGIATVALNYRLADTVRGIDYHDILADIGSAILFLQGRDSIYNCSFDTLTFLGKSAGGHLSLMYAYEKKTVSKVIAIATPTDLNDTNLLSAGEMFACVNNMLGKDDPYKRTLASPINYTNSVATHLYHGKKDPLVPYHQSVAFYNKIETFNTENKLVLFENAEHEILGQELQQIMGETIQWVKK